jgi:hypothetical protein
MTASRSVERYDIWLVYLYFTDRPTVGKVRPILIVDVEGERIAAAKITSQPPREGLAGEFAISRWSEAGLNLPSTVRCSQIFELGAKELLRDRPIGCLHPEDLPGVIEALRDAGFYDASNE